MSGFKEFTITQKILFYFSVLCLIVPIIYIIVTWSSIPAEIPTHFNAAGEADAWNAKSSIIIVVVVEALLFLIMFFVLMFPQIWNIPVKLTENNSVLAYCYTRSMLCWTMLFINIIFAYISIQSCRQASLGVLFLPVTLGALAFILIFHIIRIVRIPK